VKAFGIEFESDQAVAVVDLNLQHLQHLEAVYPGHLGVGVVTDVAHIQGEYVIHSLPVARKLQDYVLGSIYLFDLPTDSLDFGGVGLPHFADHSSQIQRDHVLERADINQEKNWALVIHLGG